MPFSRNRWPESAIILVGGAGTRLGALTAQIPKPLLQVGGRPFLFHILDFLAGQNIKQVILATGHLAGEFEKALGGKYRQLSVVFSREDQPLGTGGAVRSALQHVSGPEAFVLNGDTYFPADVASLFAAHMNNQARLSLCLRQIPDVTRYGSVTLDGNRVVALHEKGAAGLGLINGGVYLIDRAALLADAAASGTFSLERDLLPRWITEGAVAGVVSDAYFVDIGIPEDLERARRDLG